MRLPKSAYAFLLLGLISLICALAPGQAFAQAINFDLGKGPTATAHIVQVVILITVLSLAPSILVMVTSFTRVVVVLSFLRSALGTQTTPPNIVLISLALFLTLFIMQPAFDSAWENGMRPMMNNQITEEVAFQRILEPFEAFMLKHTRAKDLDLFTEISKAHNATDIAREKSAPPDKNSTASPKTDAARNAPATQPSKGEAVAKPDIQTRALIPAFMISELRRAFEIGFLLFLPFLIIDMVIASILMSMGMMMLPPSVVSLPFKIIFFVLVDGWYLVCGSLIKSYGGG